MTSKKADYIILYCFVCASILCIAMVARLFVVREMQMDEFSGVIAFLVTCLLFGAAYFSFQSIVNEWLLPVVERIFRKKHPHIETELEAEPVAELVQEESSVLNYNEYKLTAQQKLQQEQAQTLESVLAYTAQELALYINEGDMQTLCEHIRLFQFATEDECDKIESSVMVNSNLRPIDLMHFGWNIGNQFRKSGIDTATFIKRVFAKSLSDSEISTIKRKLRAEGTCIIKINETL